MTPVQHLVSDNDIDRHVDDEIAACLNANQPRSFFLFAGAGSGKTRSLVAALEHIRKTMRESLLLKGQRVGVITFTNAACDEINRRLLFDPMLDVRTIHSFTWSLIEGLNRDIREWLRSNLASEIEQLQKEETRGRKGTKASATRLNKIQSKTARLQSLEGIKRFIYNPNGDNRSRASISHSEVIQLTSHFLANISTMQSILTGRYPIILIDESQDTNKHLIDALFVVQETHKGRFALGLFGDMMQRIYQDGKEGLDQDLPDHWATPLKQLNHRCPKRIVSLINKIRSTVDGQEQRPRSDASDGVIRLFIFPGTLSDKPAAESAAAMQMAEITGDEEWANPKSFKTLTIEHRMAASRMGFLDLFTPLYKVESWRTSFLEGSLPVVRFFTKEVLPLTKAKQAEDRFAIARIAKSLSPMLSTEALQAADDKQVQLRKVSDALDLLMELWRDGSDPSLLDVLRCIAESKLLSIPESLRTTAFGDPAISNTCAENDSEDRQSEQAEAIEQFLKAPFSQVEPFASYLDGKAHFDTHQGVKGLEFERVMVIMDDSDARGFLFKYEDLFGGKPSGDKTVEATRRLFYVTCSRAKKSLALVAYSNAPDRIKNFVLDQRWFTENEIVSILMTGV